MSTIDIRLKVGFCDHPKTVKLQRKIGAEAVVCLLRLWLWARVNRPNGDLSDLDDDDIEIAAGWTGEPGAFVKAVRGVGFLDGSVLHDWDEHQGWSCGSERRAVRARFMALVRHYGRKEAARRMKELGQFEDWMLYEGVDTENHKRNQQSCGENDSAASMLQACSKHATSTAASMPTACTQHAASNAPSPSPSPYLRIPSEDKSSECILLDKYKYICPEPKNRSSGHLPRRSEDCGSADAGRNNGSEGSSLELVAVAPKSPATTDPPVIELPTNRFNTQNETVQIYQADVDAWAESFPGVDVMAELKRMKAWLMASETNRKTKRGMKKFVVNWLSRAQDKASKNPTKTPQQQPGRGLAAAVRRLKPYLGEEE